MQQLRQIQNGTARRLWVSGLGLVVLGLAYALWLSPTHAEPGAQTGSTPAGEIAANQDPDALVFFERDVRPILMKRCVRCHGGEKVNGDLNLATRELMLKGGVSGQAIDWENHTKSLFVRAISYTDIDYEMPPTGKMPQAEIETLTKWVAMGLPWTEGEKGYLADPKGETEHHDGPLTIEQGKDYWAYKPLEKPALPKIDDPAWAKNPIDVFLYAGLAEQGLKPNQEADRVTLIRRASYNLTGLPPTPQEIAAFVNDDQPGAWERVIDRLLASPHYGEAWARHWMDIARYAETDGYERDNKKQNIWRYRDYLIRAFNQDKPYNRMVKEQIAGDLLPDRDADAMIATGFMRLQIWDDEPTDRKQARADYIADIVDTTSGAFLATTVGCARCHDHKKDPIHQDDYFALYAFFNNITEQTRGNPRATSVDLRDPPTSEDQAKVIADWDQETEKLRDQIASTEIAFAQKYGTQFEKTTPKPISPDSREQPTPWRVKTQEPGKDWFVQQFDDRDWPTANGGFGNNIKRDYFNNDWKTDTIWLRRNFRLTQEPKFLMISAAHNGPIQVYINGIKVYQADRGTGPNHKRFQLPAEALKALVVGSNALAVRCEAGKGNARFIDLGLYEGVEDPRIAKLAAIESSGEKVLGAEAMKAYRDDTSDLNRLLAKPPSKAYPAFIMTEKGTQAPQQYVHERGSAHAQGEEVPPRFLKVLGGKQPEIPQAPEGVNSTGQRLALANWLAGEGNPLTARVMVNRIWQHQFGRGIVPSTSDFGQLGEQPTHPDLLNYLAVEFIERGWSIKQMQKLIMTSKAYRMASTAHAAGLEKDPGNNLFWRYNMRRLTAEEFRDSLLAINGSFNPKLYGPSIYTKMPAEVLATSSRPGSAWGNSSETERDRRSIYIHVKRSLREPLLAALDQAETDTACPVRFTTTVPTQTLITLNSEMMQEEAIVFAQRLIREAGPSLQDQVQLGLKLVLSREPDAAEVKSNVAFVESITQEHGLDRDRALKVFCLMLYNLNEFMYLD